MKPEWLDVVLKETRCMIVGYDPYSEAVVNFWKTEPTSSEYRANLDIMTEAIAHYKAFKILTYVSNLGALSEADESYTVNDWFPTLFALGYFGITAVIKPDNLFSQVSFELMVENNRELDPNTPIKFFAESQFMDAREWLKSLKRSDAIGS